MTNRLTAIALAMLLAPVASAHAQAPEPTLTVFVADASGASADTRTKEERATAACSTADAQRALERTLKAEHGNKRERWPAEAEERYRNAAELTALAAVDNLYGQVNPGAGDSVGDIERGLTGSGLRSLKEHVRLVTSAADAHVIVEVKGRRSAVGS